MSEQQQQHTNEQRRAHGRRRFLLGLVAVGLAYSAPTLMGLDDAHAYSPYSRRSRPSYRSRPSRPSYRSRFSRHSYHGYGHPGGGYQGPGGGGYQGSGGYQGGMAPAHGGGFRPN